MTDIPAILKFCFMKDFISFLAEITKSRKGAERNGVEVSSFLIMITWVKIIMATCSCCSASLLLSIAWNMAGIILLRWRVNESPATVDKIANARVLTGGVVSW